MLDSLLNTLHTTSDAIGVLIDRIPAGFWVVLYAVWVVCAVVFILSQRRSPQATMAWTIAFITLPGLSALAYSIFGPRRLKRQRIRRLLAKRLFSRVAATNVPELDPEKDPAGWALRQKLQSVAQSVVLIGEAPPRHARRVRVLQDGEQTYEAIEHAFGTARRHIHLEYYIFEPDEVGTRWRDRLAERAREGIEVRLLVDALGSYRCRSSFWKPLIEAGGEVRLFNRPRLLRWRPGLFNFRSHRKIVVIDGTLAFTGGINVSGGSYLSGTGEGNWRDTHVLIEGPPAMDLQALFIEDWLFAGDERHLKLELIKRVAEIGGRADENAGPHASRSRRHGAAAHGDRASPTDPLAQSDLALAMRAGPALSRRRQRGTTVIDNAAIDNWFPSQPAADGPWCQVVASGPDVPDSATHRLYFLAITTAARRVWMATPYFIPDEALMTALVATAARGIDVRLLVPSHGDSRIVTAAAATYCEYAARHGIRVSCYQPRMLHAKTLIVDDAFSLIGTVNMDNRSFRLNFEACVAFYDGGMNQQLADAFEADLKDAVEFDRQGAPSFVPRLLDSAARLFAPLL